MSFLNTIQENSQQDLMVAVYIKKFCERGKN